MHARTPDSKRVGHLAVRGTRSFVLCDSCNAECDPPEGTVPLYHVNVFPYRQDCYLCSTVLVESGESWPILFTGGVRD